MMQKVTIPNKNTCVSHRRKHSALSGPIRSLYPSTGLSKQPRYVKNQRVLRSTCRFRRILIILANTHLDLFDSPLNNWVGTKHEKQSKIQTRFARNTHDVCDCRDRIAAICLQFKIRVYLRFSGLVGFRCTRERIVLLQQVDGNASAGELLFAQASEDFGMLLQPSRACLRV